MTEEALTLEDVRAAFLDHVSRYTHIEGVVRMAEHIEKTYGKFDGKLKLAAIYHDIGYSKQWRVTGFHAVDGTIAAREHGLGEDIAEAVLYHGGSWREVRRLRPDLMGYYAPECQMMRTPLSRALCYCDLHTGPRGQKFSIEERLADIFRRYGADAEFFETYNEYKDRIQAINNEWLPFLKLSKQKVA